LASNLKKGDQVIVNETWDDPKSFYHGAEGVVTDDSNTSESARVKITKCDKAPKEVGKEFHLTFLGRKDAKVLPLPVGRSTQPKEAVDHPDHYGGDTTYEVFKVVEAWGLDEDAYLFNVVKYVARAKKKGKFLEDLKKARVYLDRRIKQLEDAQ
jgi:hypothetical protein